MVIEEIHERIESSYDKPLLFTGIVIDGVEKNDVYATPSVNGDGYDVTLYDKTLHISNIDVVSISTPLVINGDYFRAKNGRYVYVKEDVRILSIEAPNKQILLIGINMNTPTRDYITTNNFSFEGSYGVSEYNINLDQIDNNLSIIVNDDYIIIDMLVEDF